MFSFFPVDWLWLSLFLGLMIGCGAVFYRLGQRSESDFFLAGRGLPWWLPATSVYATHTATDTPMWVTGVVYQHGLRGIWYTFFSAWCAISAFVSARIFRRSLAYSQAEWQSLRYGGLGAELLRGWLAGWQVFMNAFILGWVGMAMGKVGHHFLGWPVWVGLIIPSVICAFYVLMAGYWGVVMGDFLQGIVAFGAIVLASAWCIAAAGGPSGIVEALYARGEGWRLDPFHFTGWTEGDFPFAWFLTMMVIAIIGGFGMGTSIDWYAESQRIQSSKTVKDAAYCIWTGSVLVVVRNSIWAAAILAFYVLAPGIGEQSTYEMGWYALSLQVLPHGLLGFFIAALLAIHLSTVSTHLNLGALYMTRDLYHHYLDPEASEERLVWVARVSTAVLLIASFVFGMVMDTLTEWLIFALWIMAAGVWLPNILQVVWWRFNSWGYLTAWVFNLVVSWVVVWILPALGYYEELPQHVAFWLLMVLSAAVYIPVTFVTPPERMDRLATFYAMCRPLGWWGPVRKHAIATGLMDPAGPEPGPGAGAEPALEGTP